MDEQLKKCLLKWEKEARLDNEIRIRRIALIPGLCTVDGEDIGSVLLSKKYSSFLHEDADKIQYNYTIFEKKLTFQTLKRMLAFLDGRERDIKNSLECNISILSSLVSSLEKMIQDKRNEADTETSEVVEAIQKFISHFKYYKLLYKISFSFLFDSMRKGFKRKSSTKGIDKTRMKLSYIIYSEIFILFDVIKTETIFLYLAAHDYFYDPSEKKDVFANMIIQASNNISNNVVQLLSMPLNSIKKDTEQIANKTELLLKSRETKNESLKAIKENQEKIKELVKDRNEMDAEKTGTLSVEECVVIIGLITKHYFDLKQRDCKAVGFPLEVVKMPKESTIRRNIEFWDQYQNGNKAKGRKPPRKDYSRKKSKEEFGAWYNEIQLDQYNKWKAKNRIDALIGKSKKRFGDE